MLCLPDVIARENSVFFSICSSLVFLNHRLDLDRGLINQLLPIEFKGEAGETQSLAETGRNRQPCSKVTNPPPDLTG
jgi:hypothetical protein